jgi:glycine betaine/proline transport system ATP-binding protein
MQIIELLPIAFNAKTPIVVLDDQNKMRGIIRRAAVISSIMGEEK